MPVCHQISTQTLFTKCNMSSNFLTFFCHLKNSDAAPSFLPKMAISNQPAPNKILLGICQLWIEYFGYKLLWAFCTLCEMPRKKLFFFGLSLVTRNRSVWFYLIRLSQYFLNKIYDFQFLSLQGFCTLFWPLQLHQKLVFSK